MSTLYLAINSLSIEKTVFCIIAVIFYPLLCIQLNAQKQSTFHHIISPFYLSESHFIDAPKIKKTSLYSWFFSSLQLGHIGEALHRLRKVGNGLIRVSMFDSIPDAVLDVPFQHHLSYPVEC